MNATTTTPDEQEYGDVEGIGTGSIHARIARVQRTVRNMPKNKTATIRMKNGGEYSFDYIDKGALEAEVRNLLSPEGVAIYISEERIEQTGNRCIVTVAITLACDAQGLPDFMTIKRSGYGNADDDKGPAKAGTTAVRLALADLLLQGGDDVAEHDYVEYRPDVAGQALQPGDRPATVDQLKFATDLIMRLGLDKANTTAMHALIRLCRPIAQGEIGPGLPVEDAIRLIPAPVASKLIERLEKLTPGPAVPGAVWDKITEWEVEGGYSASVEPEDTKVPETTMPTDTDVVF